VADAGLVHLKGLTELQELHLSDTRVTDARLVHFKGLTKLQMLDLRNTQVTDVGLADLQTALPKCEILTQD
jgi:Leucine-rich repeat (LRR) protein